MKTKYENIIQKGNGKYEAMFRMRGELVYVGIFTDIEQAHTELQEMRVKVNKRQLQEMEDKEQREAQKDSYWKHETLSADHFRFVVVHNYPQDSSLSIPKMFNDYLVRHSSSATPNGFAKYVESLNHRYMLFTQLQFNEIQKGSEVILSRHGSDAIVLRKSKMNNDEFSQFDKIAK